MIADNLLSASDLDPNAAEGTLTVRIRGMTCPAHNKAISNLLTDLTNLHFRHPETNARMIYALV